MATVANTMRVTGLFSGMDTDALVKAMSMAQQSKVDTLNAKKKQAEWKKDILTDFNNKIRVFRDTYGSVLGENTLMSRGAYTSFAVKMAENTGISVTASATARAGGYNVRVEQTAAAASMQGAKLTGRAAGLTDAEINASAFSDLTALTNGGYTPGVISFSINGKDFSFDPDVTLRKIMDEVNKADAGVTMSYSQASDRVTIASVTTGAYDPENADPNKMISFDDTSGFLRHLGLTGEDTGTVANGRDAIVYLNGEPEALRLDSNSVTLDGVHVTFLRPTGENGVDYTLVEDYKPAVDRIKSMVEAYNALIKELHTAYNQKVSREYRPLTEEQRADMTEKEADEWEAKAREGLLYRDNTLNRLLENMRGVLTKTFGDQGNLASIGITTGKYAIGEPVRLELDEAKLMAALEAGPDRVYQLMSASEKDGGGGGFITRLNKMMDDYVNTIKGRDLQNLSNNIHDYTKRVKEQEDKLTVMSEKYYLQYAKLETALGQMQSQQNQMASLFGWNNGQ